MGYIWRRQQRSRPWFDWNLEVLRFVNRVGVYLALMDDRYPSTDEQQSVRLDFPYPDAGRDLNRWLPLVSGSSRSRTTLRSSSYGSPRLSS